MLVQRYGEEETNLLSMPLGFGRARSRCFEGFDGLVEFLVLNEKVDVIVVISTFRFDDVVGTENEETLFVRKVFYKRGTSDMWKHRRDFGVVPS